jgi:surface antigen
MMAGTKIASAWKASAWKAWAKTRFLSFAVLLTLGTAHAAVAKTETTHHHSHLAARHTTHHHYAYARHHSRSRSRYAHYNAHHHGLRYASAHYSYSRLQCVPYAREVSHIELSGDAFLWWAEASGRYARGSVPVEGAVLNFRSIGRMPLGHVAVVTSVVDSRTILVTQANWVHGSITNDVTMQDVSPNNDWTEVEVELGDSSRWGAAYPTYGFIYNQPANSTVIAAAAPSDEVAEAPRPAPISTDAPDRNLQ